MYEISLTEPDPRAFKLKFKFFILYLAPDLTRGVLLATVTFRTQIP